jgi:hypothetical protein
MTEVEVTSDHQVYTVFNFRDELMWTSDTLISSGSWDMALTQWDGKTGQRQQLQHVKSPDRVQGWDTEGGSNGIWLTGQATDSTEFGGKTYVAGAQGDLFWGHWMDDGSWDTVGFVSNAQHGYGSVIDRDPRGKLYLAGQYRDSIKLNDLNLTAPIYGSYIIKRWGPGQWSKPIQPELSCRVTDLILDSMASVFVSGIFEGASLQLDTIKLDEDTVSVKSHAFFARLGCWVPTPQISGDTLLCKGDTTTLSVSEGDSYTYNWSNGDTGKKVSVDQPQTYSVMATDPLGCISEPAQHQLKEKTLSPLSITQSCDTLHATGSHDRFYWYRNDSLYRITERPYVLVRESGNYQVRGGDECIVFSDTVNVVYSGSFGANRVYPNPVNRVARLPVGTPGAESVQVIVRSSNGVPIKKEQQSVEISKYSASKKKGNCNSKPNTIKVSMEELPPGQYVIQLLTTKRQWVYKVVKL